MKEESPFKVVAYYTDKYEYNVHPFELSCKEHGVPFIVKKVDDLGSWKLNTHYKPKFIRHCLDEYAENIVYVDIDARFQRYPVLFERIEADVAFHKLGGVEVLSGTVFFKNNQRSRWALDKWIEACNTQTDVWEQTKLERSLGVATVEYLPIEYCAIFDHPLVQRDQAVILHMQASRQHRRD